MSDKNKNSIKDTDELEARRAFDNEQLDFVGDIEQSKFSDPPFYSYAIIYILLLFLVVGIIWAYFANLQESTIVPGRVIPSSKVKDIQNLEGGILAKLYVKEGQVVDKGQILAKLDDTTFSSQYKDSQIRYLALLASIARLRAEAAGKVKIKFPQAVLADKKLVSNEQELFNSRQKSLQEKLATLDRSYQLALKELRVIEPLVKKRLLSQIDLLKNQREVNKLKGALDAERNKFREKARTDLNEDLEERNRLIETLRSLKDRMQRTELNSPVHGIVKQIQINTIGGVIQPGMVIMEIVPIEDSLLIEAQVRPQDIAFIRPGQEATVKITAYDFTVYGSLEGKVTHISADSTLDKEGQSYFEVWIRTKRNYLGSADKKLPIIPGMTAQIHIITGQKTVLNYLLKPLLKARHEALRER